MLQVKNLCFDYADNPLLEQINLSVPTGKLLHLRGENGSGKTTLLKLIAGALTPTHGEIYFQNHSIHQHKSEYQRSLCYVGHKAGISHALSPWENCQFDIHQGRRAVEWAQLMSALALTGLDHVPCGRLSAGQRRRVALMRLLMSDAQLWLLDEPFVALDQNAIAFLTQSILQHMAEGGAVVLTSHQPLPLSREFYLEYTL